jgi:hypothetical protein
MKHYDLEDNEKDMLKVIKLNQQKSAEAQNTLDTLKNQADRYISAHNEMLDKVRNYIDVPDMPTDSPMIILPEPRTRLARWEELVSEANELIADDIGFEDILSSEEFAAALNRADAIDAKFSKMTALTRKDMIFLVTATALQCVRQYVIGPWLKDHRPKASSKDESRKGNAEPGWYYVETEKILANRVPFDATKYGSASTVKGFLKGGNHRLTTLGHDPLLGWLFGTANILTCTVTRRNFDSAHVKYKPGIGPVIHSLADTTRVFRSCKERFFNEGWNGKIAVASAIGREALHLNSDIRTKMALPIPIIPSISPGFANDLAKYGIDTASVGTEASLSLLINTLVSMTHRLFYDEGVDDKKLYEVRTRKILLYSNVIASTSNIIIALITKNPKILDVGGLLITITRLFSDLRFIARVKQEFIENEHAIHFKGIADEVDKLYSGYFFA